MCNRLIVTADQSAAAWIQDLVGGPPMMVIPRLHISCLSPDLLNGVTDIFGVIPLRWMALFQAIGIRCWTLETGNPLRLRRGGTNTQVPTVLEPRLVRYELLRASNWADQISTSGTPTSVSPSFKVDSICGNQGRGS